MIKKSKILMLGLTLVFLFSLSVNVTAKDFSDLAKTSWAYNAVSEMTNYGVIDGYTDGTFKPQKHVTRAEFSKLLVATLDIDEDEKLTNPIVFEDVPQTNWAYPYILKAGNYLTGYKVKGKYYFYPSNDAVREDMAVAMVVASGLSNVDYDTATLKKFKDADKITPALQKYVAIAVEHGLMKGNSNGTFNAKGTLTRAEAAQLMVNFVHSEKLSLEDIEKLIKEDGNGPVLHEKYGYIDLGEDYSKYQYTDDETWHTATSRYLHKSSNPKTAQCSNFYGTDIQIREIKNKDKVYSFKVPYVAPIQIEFDKSTNKIDLGENWHAYDICTTDLETLKDAKSGSYK
ncbi:MAG: S-layer homology domain-containing protein [Clostridia bacterium]|nr:S-layer homology domain-containing protein [Clostridia bacterium]